MSSESSSLVPHLVPQDYGNDHQQGLTFAKLGYTMVGWWLRRVRLGSVEKQRLGYLKSDPQSCCVAVDRGG